MAVHRVRCPCRGKLSCELCHGTKYYDYEVGPRGWMPFTCPTCQGGRTRPGEGGPPPEPCPTCQGEGLIDPGNPPLAEGTTGFIRKLWRIFMGG